MKYIDAEKLKAEIERQMKFYDEKEKKAWEYSEQGYEDALWYQGHRKMCAKLLTFIDSLSEEEPYSVSISPMKEWSEEQMSMLLAVINDPNNAGAESCQLSLKSLYEQLSKRIRYD